MAAAVPSKREGGQDGIDKRWLWSFKVTMVVRVVVSACGAETRKEEGKECADE